MAHMEGIVHPEISDSSFRMTQSEPIHLIVMMSTGEGIVGSVVEHNTSVLGNLHDRFMVMNRGNLELGLFGLE